MCHCLREPGGLYGEVRQEGRREGQEGDERAQTRHAQERPVRQEGQEQEAGHRDRPLTGAQGGWEGASKEGGVEEGRFEEERGAEELLEEKNVAKEVQLVGRTRGGGCI